MGTYPLKQIMTDYENGTLTPEMVSGHILQHLDKLYEAQAAANISRYGLRSQVDTLESRVALLQVAVDRLTAVVEKCRPPHKRKPRGKAKDPP